MPKTRLVNRNITTKSRRSSMRMEPEFWDALREIGRREGLRSSELADRAMLAHSGVARRARFECLCLPIFAPRSLAPSAFTRPCDDCPHRQTPTVT